MKIPGLQVGDHGEMEQVHFRQFLMTFIIQGGFITTVHGTAFLSLRKTSLVKIVVPGYEDKPSWQTPINTKYNETYYNEKIKETEVIRLAILAPMIWLTVNIR